MSSISVSLTAGMRSNLFSLQQTGKLLNTTQKRLSSGKKVNTALDDPINFFSALGHSQRASDLAGRKDHMGEAIQTIQQLLTSAKSLAQSALNTDDQSGRTALVEQYAGLLAQINHTAGDANYKWINLLMLQTRQVLGTTALSLASQASQSVLQLF